MTGMTSGYRFGLTGLQLKMTAMFTMLIDHMGAILFPQYRWMRIVGRLAFPIFAFLLTEGFLHTKDRNAYLRRLAVFAFISEPVFDFAFFGRFFYASHQNIFFTLAISLILLKKLEEEQGPGQRILWFAIIAMLAEIIGCDYGTGGVLTVLIFYQYRNNKLWMSLFFALTHMMVWGSMSIQSYAALALIPILLYNGRQGCKVKYAFYVFYPAHLLVLTFVSQWIAKVDFWTVITMG